MKLVAKSIAIVILVCFGIVDASTQIISTEKLNDILIESLKKTVSNLPDPLQVADLDFTITAGSLKDINTILSAIKLLGLNSIEVKDVQLINESITKGEIILFSPKLDISGTGMITGRISPFLPNFTFSGSFIARPADITVQVQFTSAKTPSDVFTLTNVSSAWNFGSNIDFSFDILMGTLSTLNEIIISRFKSEINSQILKTLITSLIPDLQLLLENATIVHFSESLKKVSTTGSNNSTNAGPLCNSTLAFVDQLVTYLKDILNASDPIRTGRFQLIFILVNNGQLSGFSKIQRVGDAKVSCNTTDGRDVALFNLSVSNVQFEQHGRFYFFGKWLFQEIRATLSTLLIQVQVAIGGAGMPSVLQVFDLIDTGNVNTTVLGQSRLIQFLSSSPWFRFIIKNIVVRLVFDQIRLAFNECLQQM
ncbi:uncharacterized protein LOC111085404 [Limulus polyphemus]|uniref:Uncharacterized protein LOC111085404 n=1 Tax=Limulus polyphemus TaxID=6850 RepID=A0ABM1S7A1_LIMPO|nr:uncharacterized protein LOC111085404 [Limulus polyphemus]